MKKAILVVSFGTTHLDALQNAIEATEQQIAAAFPEHVIYRAFTSNIIRRRLLENQEIHVDSVSEALERIAGDGIKDVTVQPTLLIPGEEFDRVCAMVKAACGDLSISMGAPLMQSDSDMEQIITLLQEIYPVGSDTLLILMGHGTEHPANDLYIRLGEKMRDTRNQMILCTIEGTPTFADGVQEAKKHPQRKAVIAPLMLVAGDHAKNDMASEEPDSLRSLLEQAGFTVGYRIQGLGQSPSIRRLYVDRIRNAKPL